MGSAIMDWLKQAESPDLTTIPPYPLDIQEGDPWQAQMTLRHKGPAAEVDVRVAIVLPNGVRNWSNAVRVSLPAKADWGDTETPPVSGVWTHGGLPECNRFDTELYVHDLAGTQIAGNSSTERYHSVGTGLQVQIVGDRYYAPATGWGGWQPT